MHKNKSRFFKKHFRLISCLSLLLSLVALGANCAKSEMERLTSGQPLTASIINEEVHHYAVKLEKGHFLSLSIDQHDVDVISKVYAPDGELIGEFDTPTSGRGTELIRIGSETAGDYHIEVYTLSERAEPGEYVIKIVDFHPITDRDRQILAAVNYHLEADRLRANAETRPASIDVYKKALQIWREVGEASDEANTLRAMGFAYQRLNDLEEAKSHFEQALVIWERIGDLRSAAFTHVIFGVISRKQGDDRMGLEHDLMAQPLWQSAEDMPEYTQNLVRIGNDYIKLQNNDEALKYFEKALDSSRRLERKSIEAYVLSECGGAQATFGNKDKALEYYKRSVEIWKGLNQDKVVARLEEKMAKL